ncbi:MAG: hypothetical protein JST63_09100 [Bacteroidetes bacterium]|nr:hypothetical protein [Bacteroidota bacterium]
MALLFTGSNSYAQTKSEIALSKKIYEGTWYNKKEKRYIRIYYDDEVNYVTINDWIKGKGDSEDAYKAFINGGKLILYAENDDHHTPYCEIEIENTKLIYRCNKMNFTDNFLHTEEPGDKTIFERVKLSNL